MNWPGPILTDSGGFQVMSLAQLRKITEEGVTFRSHIDGSAHELTPERSIEIQRLLGADITMVLRRMHAVSGRRSRRPRARCGCSMRWAERCTRRLRRARRATALFGIVQGSVYPALRAESAAALVEIGFDGYAIGGLAVGEGQDAMFATLEATVPLLPADRPRYLMGVGKPDDLVGAVARGIDMFDCVMPTRSGRTGQAFTRRGALNIRNARHPDDPRPLDESCACPACRDYSRAYLHHLCARRRDPRADAADLAQSAPTTRTLMGELRDAIAEQRVDEYRTEFAAAQAKGDIEPV